MTGSKLNKVDIKYKQSKKVQQSTKALGADNDRS